MINERPGGYFQTADWKTEKHAPVAECADKAVNEPEMRVNMVHALAMLNPVMQPVGHGQDGWPA